MIAGSRFLGISNTNNFTKIRQNSKSLIGVSIESRISLLMKKNRSQKFRWAVPLKGQSNEIFYLRFFHWWNTLKPLTWFLKTFEFGFQFVEIFTIFDWLSAVFYSGESIFPILFTTESCDSASYWLGVTICQLYCICTNSHLSFNTESQYSLLLLIILITAESHYSPPHLQQEVTVDSGELFSKTLKDSLFL
jgi:hypothetical protein